ncbi:hypothetical protein L9F63_001668, partial [Diploptera punctata]
SSFFITGYFKIHSCIFILAYIPFCFSYVYLFTIFTINLINSRFFKRKPQKLI